MSARAGPVAADYGIIGAALGFVLAVGEFVALMVLASRIERNVDTSSAPGTARLLRIAAGLGLVLSTGIGYLIGWAISG